MTLDIDTIASNSGFEQPAHKPALIKIIGVGGGGGNAVSYMYSQQEIEGVSYVVLNTDWQALNASPVPCKVVIGDGLGAGGKPEVGCAKAEADKQKIEQLFDEDTKMVFITAGMGGGTGTGAGPVVARLAHERGILTVGIVTIPFLFEGRMKINKALDGADQMAQYVDSLLIINNEQLVNIYPDLDWLNAFNKADDILAVAARSISELIAYNGRWNLDFEDVNTTLRNGGPAIISTATGEGEHRVTRAFENAINSPLLKKHDIFSAKRMLVNIYFNPQAENKLAIGEADEISRFMANFTNEQDLIVGQTVDDTLGNEVKITVMATGFDMAIDTLGGDTPHVIKAANKTTADGTPRIAKSSDNAQRERLIQAYGIDAITTNEREHIEKQYVILQPDDMDDPTVIEALRDTPAYNRPSGVKADITHHRDTRPAPTGAGTHPAPTGAGTHPAPTGASPHPAPPATGTTIAF